MITFGILRYSEGATRNRTPPRHPLGSLLDWRHGCRRAASIKGAKWGKSSFQLGEKGKQSRVHHFNSAGVVSASAGSEPVPPCYEPIPCLPLRVGMSMPDEFLIFRGEGKIFIGPDGVLVSPDCPFVVKRLAQPHLKSFEQVRRWIMNLFQLDEWTHELTLQHILYVRTNPLAPPSYVLIDIIGDDSWRAFLNVALRHVGSFKLFVKWNVKRTSSVSKAINNNTAKVVDEDPAGTDASDDGIWPTCKHDKPCTIETSWDRQDPGRRFFRCPLFAESMEDSGFTQWLIKSSLKMQPNT